MGSLGSSGSLLTAAKTTADASMFLERNIDVVAGTNSDSRMSREQIKRNRSEQEMGRKSAGGVLQSSQQTKTSTPCAACKLLRRRCAQECPFSPYFSALEPQKFASVHKVFGASNVSKMLMEVPENQRADAASSLVYEADARLRDPVYGCLGAIAALQQQAQSLQAELQAVRSQIMRCRFQESAMAAAHTLPTTALGSLQMFNIERTGSSSISSSQTTASTDHYTVGSPESAIASIDLKERYWSQMHQS